MPPYWQARTGGKKNNGIGQVWWRCSDLAHSGGPASLSNAASPSCSESGDGGDWDGLAEEGFALVCWCRRRRYSQQTQSMCKIHCREYPRTHTRKGVRGFSSLLNINTAKATCTKAKFQIRSRTTTGLEYAQSLCRSSSCSAADSRTSIDGSLMIRRPPARRKYLAAPWTRLLPLRLLLPSSPLPLLELPLPFPSKGVESMDSGKEGTEALLLSIICPACSTFLSRPPSPPHLSRVSLSVSLRRSPFRESSFLQSDLEAQRSSSRKKNETLHSSLVVSKIVPRRWEKDSGVELVAFCIFSRQCTTLTTISTDALDQGGKDRSELQTVIHPHGRSVLTRSIDQWHDFGNLPFRVPRILTHIQQNFDQEGRKLLIKGRPKKKFAKSPKEHRHQSPYTIHRGLSFTSPFLFAGWCSSSCNCTMCIPLVTRTVGAGFVCPRMEFRVREDGDTAHNIHTCMWYGNPATLKGLVEDVEAQSGGSWVSEEKKKEKEKKQGDGFVVHGCSHFRKSK